MHRFKAIRIFSCVTAGILLSLGCGRQGTGALEGAVLGDPCEDNDPFLRCGDDVTVTISPGTQTPLPNLAASVEAVEFCGQVTKTQNPPAGTMVGETTTVLVEVRDESETRSCTRTLEVIVACPPNAQCNPEPVCESFVLLCLNADGIAVPPESTPPQEVLQAACPTTLQELQAQTDSFCPAGGKALGCNCED